MPETDRQRCVIDGLLDASLCDELVFVTKALSTVGYRPGVNSCTIHHLAMMAPYLLVPLVAARQRVWQAVEAAFGLEFELFVEFTGLISWTAGASIGWHHDANRNYLQQRHFSAVVYLNNPDDPPHARCAAADNDFAPAASVPAAGVTTSGSPCAGHLPRPGPPAAGGDGGGFTGGDFEFQSDGDLNPGSSSCLSGAEDGGHCMPAACQGAGGSVSEARSPSLTVRPATGRCVAYAADGRNVHRVCELLLWW